MIFLHKDKVIRSLMNKKYAHVPSEGLLFPANDLNEWNTLKNSWQNLPYDEYMQNGDKYRKRAFGKFIFNMEENNLLPLEDNIFYQNEAINSYAGGLQRSLPSMPDEIK